jgi:hypothetical protein
VTGWDVLVGTALLYVLIWHSLSDRMTPRDEQDGIKAGWTRGGPCACAPADRAVRRG